MAKPFSRARPRGGPPLTGLLEAGNILTVAADPDIETPRQHRRTVSESTVGERAGEEPPLSIPRQWGRRTRPRADLNRRHTERQLREQDEDSILRHETRYTGDSDPEDFNMESVLVSTPANINRRDRPIDQLMKEDDEVDVEDEIRAFESKAARTAERDPSPALEMPLRQKKETTKTVTFQSRRPHERGDSMTLLRKLARATSTSPSPKAESKQSEPPREEPPVAPRPKEDIAKNNSLRDPRRVISEPPHPKSALEAIVNEAKENRDPQYGDNTIASLEDIMNPNLDYSNSTLNNTSDAGAAPQGEERTYRPSKLAEITVPDTSDEAPRTTSSGRNLTQAEKDRRQEDLAFEALNKRLTTAHSSLTDANRGLRRIENRIEGVDAADTNEQKPATSDKGVSTAAEAESATAKKTETKTVSSKAPVQAPAPISIPTTTVVQCARCSGRSLWHGLWSEFWGNFYIHDERGRRLTWLGWLLFFWCAWLITELTLHDVYADYIYGPIFPFVTFNVTVRTILSFFGKGW